MTNTNAATPCELRVWAQEKDKPGFKYKHCHRLAGHPWASHVSLSVSIPVVITRIKTPSSQGHDVAQVKPWMWKPFQTQVHGHVSHSSECQWGQVLGGDGYQAFLSLIMEMVPESMWESPTSSWILGRISCLWVSFDLGGKRSSLAIAKQNCDAGASNSTAPFHQALCECCLIWASQQPSQSRYCYHSYFGEGDGGSERHSNSNWDSIAIVIGLMSFSLWLIKWGFKLRSIWSRGLACSSCRLWISLSRNGCLGASWERWELRRVLRVLLFLLPTQTSVASAGISISGNYGFRDKDCFPKMSVSHFRPWWE